MINRRAMLQGMAAGVVAPLGLGLLPADSQAATQSAGGPKRVIFFLQNHGFDPLTCIPKGLIRANITVATMHPRKIRTIKNPHGRLNFQQSTCA